MRLRIFLLYLLIFGCSKDSIPDPSPVKLLTPTNGNNCESAIPINLIESKVNFSWVKSENTDKYELVVKNSSQNKIYTEELDGSDIENDIQNIYYNMLLLTSETYTWHVLSKSISSPVSTQSDVWQFYLEGNVEPDYIPQPSNLNYPENESTLSLEESDLIKFSWSSKDEDNNVDYYHFYLGQEIENLLRVGDDIKQSTYEQKLEINKIYYWKIMTFDTQGNSSDSGINKFYTVP